MASSVLSDLAADVQAALSDLAGDLTYQPAGAAPMGCAGFVEAIDLTRVSVSGVQAGDLKVMILANTLPVTPRGGDRVVIDGRSRAVVSVARDPAKALWTLLVRG